MSTEIITPEVLRYMEENTIDYIENWRLRESSTLFEYYLQDLSYFDLINTMAIPSGNRVQMSNGQIVLIPTQEKIIMFPTTKRLYDDNEIKDQILPTLQTLKERGEAKRRSFSVYINGKRIPDTSVMVFASPNGTDLFIPARMFASEHLNTLVCTVHDYSNGSYSEFFNDVAFGGLVQGISIPQQLWGKFEKKHMSVFVNGLYVSPDSYSITIQNTSVVQILFQAGVVPSQNYTIEVIIDGTILGNYSDNYLNSSGDLFAYIPKDAAALIETAVFQYMCDTYINGLRIANIDIAQKSYRHLQYKRPVPNEQIVAPYKTHIVVSDRHALAEAFAHYIDIFMEYDKWVSEEMAVKQLAGDGLSSYDIKPPFINYATMEFPPNNKYIFDSDVTRLMSNDQRAKAMIDENSHYLESLLRYYGVEEEVYTVQRGAEPDISNKLVSILLDNDDSDDLTRNTRSIELYVNDKKIPESELRYVSKAGADFVQIPITKFRQNETDTIKVYRYYSNNQASERIRFTTIEPWVHTNNWKAVSGISSASGGLGVYDLDELVVFMQLDKNTDNDHYYVESPGAQLYFGIVPNDPVNYQLRETILPSGAKNLEIMIPNGSIIPSNAIVYIVNQRFHASKTFVISSENNTINNESRLVLNTVENGEVVPRTFGDYLIKTYINGELCIPKLDYFVVTPESNNRITNALIIFRRKVFPGDVVEIVYTGTKNIFITGYSEIPVSNKYGYIFLSSLTIPFSMDYMDLFIDNKKLTKDDVVVYTDRLIRIKNIQLPFTNVALFTRLNVGIPDIQQYIDEYLLSGCLFDDYIKTFCQQIDYDDTSTIDPNNPNLSDVLENNQSGGPPAIEVPINPNPTPTDRIDPFMDRFGRDMNADRNRVSKYFDANEYKLIDFDDYLVLLDEDIINAHKIKLDANSKENMREDFIFDPNRYYRSIPEVVSTVADLFKVGAVKDAMDSNKTMLDYMDPLINKFLYPSGVVAFDSNPAIMGKDKYGNDIIISGITFPDADEILDSNVIESIEEE